MFDFLKSIIDSLVKVGASLATGIPFLKDFLTSIGDFLTRGVGIIPEPFGGIIHIVIISYLTTILTLKVITWIKG